MSIITIENSPAGTTAPAIDGGAWRKMEIHVPSQTPEGQMLHGPALGGCAV